MYLLPHRRIMSGAAAISAMALLASSGIVLAQDQSPDMSPAAQADGTMAAGSQAHPLHIHAGTCDQLGDVIFPLGEISTDLMVNGEPAGGTPLGGVSDQKVAVNMTVVAATLAELTASPHAINIHQSEADMGTRVACGDISGVVFDTGTLVIRLDEHDASGSIGVALLKENGDGNTAVYSMLTEKDANVDSPAMAGDQAAATELMMPTESMMPDAAATDGTVTVTVEVDEQGDVDVDVATPEESPAA